MEGYTMFLDSKNQYCQNDYTTQGNLQIQFNPYQFINGLFQRTRAKNFLIYMETQKNPNNQSNLEKEKQSWWNQTPWLQAILQSYSNQNSTVLAQKQTHTSMEQNRDPRNEPTFTYCAVNLWQKEVRMYSGEKTASSINSVGKTGQLHANVTNWTTFSPHIQKY